jgi:hypothetical protein
MTFVLFVEFLTCFGKEMAAKNLKVLLFVAQYTAHLKDISKSRST